MHRHLPPVSRCKHLALEELIPAEVLKAIKDDGIVLSEIRDRAIHTGFKAQILFERKLGQKNFRVWLE